MRNSCLTSDCNGLNISSSCIGSSSIWGLATFGSCLTVLMGSTLSSLTKGFSSRGLLLSLLTLLVFVSSFTGFFATGLAVFESARYDDLRWLIRTGLGKSSGSSFNTSMLDDFEAGSCLLLGSRDLDPPSCFLG
jgi:hypothetical protein